MESPKASFIERKRSSVSFYLTAVALTLSFALSLVSVVLLSIDEMGTDPLFVLQIIPLPYWVGISGMACAIFFMLKHLSEKRYRRLMLLSSILLMICFRMVFPIAFTSIPAYEPDATNYMSVVSSWAQTGVNFGVEGDYHHNYPLSFLIAYTFIKLGVSMDLFFRIAPFVIYSLEIILVYLLTELILPEKHKKGPIPVISAFLFSFSSLAYWVTLHYSPDLLGSLMYFVTLYLGVKFALSNKWTIKSVLPVFLSIFALILSHHLSTLYLVVTFFGLSLSAIFFRKESQFKNGIINFFILAIMTYTLWFAYGTLIYPSFFKIYVYFSGFTSVSVQTANAGLLNNVAFAIYPVFIIGLFVIEFSKYFSIFKPISIQGFIGTIKNFSIQEAKNITMLFTVGFNLVLLLFIIGLGIPVLFGSRILEVLCIGLYPLASMTMNKLLNGNTSKKTRYALLVIITLFVILSGVYRYYSAIQRRVIV